MKERPIFFNGEMVRAILDDRKTQTRRVIKPQPVVSFWCGSAPTFRNYRESKGKDSRGSTGDLYREYCPYGQIGDRLWVRETHCFDEEDGVVCLYKATDGKPDDLPWRPSIHMPRWASRILLEITDIRVERVQDTSHEDMTAEGVDTSGPVCAGVLMLMTKTDNIDDAHRVMHRACWAALWDSINKKRGYGWDVNPWVWVVEFKVVEGK